MGQDGGLSSGSRSIRRFPFRGSETDGARRARDVSEAFRGEFNQKVDSKARVSIPATFRRVLEAGDPEYSRPDRAENARPRMVIVYGGKAGDAHAVGYSITQMKRVEAQIRRLPPGTPARKALERNLVTLSQTVEVDDDGRIVLPPKARDRMGITADDLKNGVDATFAGTLETFQMWKRDAYEAAQQAEVPLDDLLEDGADLTSLLPHEPGE